MTGHERRPAQTEPTDDERDATVALAEYDRSQPSDYERAYADPLAKALRALLRRPAQGEPTDAQVIAALNAWHQDVMPVNRLGVFGTWKEDRMRAALNAAFTAGQEDKP